MDMINWPEGPPPEGIVDQPGSTEMLGNVAVTHRYLEGGGITWHAAVAGNEGRLPIIMLHGYPESWYAFHHQIMTLAEDFYIIALDLPGFGQSDKRLDIDYDYGAVAQALSELIDAMALKDIFLVSHDRGTVIADHLCAVPGMNGRIKKYVRMQQSGCVPHGEPRPPHEMFRSEAAVAAFRQPAMIVHQAYVENPITAFPPSKPVLQRMERELSYPGVAEGAAASFVSADFDAEHADRMDRLFAAMTMPVLFLQGALDIGQKPDEYLNIYQFVPTATLQFIHAGHFLHLESPAETSAAIKAFLLHHPT